MNLSLSKHMGAALALITGGFFPHPHPQGPEGHLARDYRVIPVGGGFGFVVDNNMVTVVAGPDATIAAQIPIANPDRAEGVVQRLQAVLADIEARAELSAGTATVTVFPGAVSVEVRSRTVVLRMLDRAYTFSTSQTVAQLIAALGEVVAQVEARVHADQGHPGQSNDVEKWPIVAKTAVATRGLPSQAIASMYK